jgi:hypothetical protein
VIEPIPWTSREFTFDLPVGAFPARAAELVCGVPEKMLSHRMHGKWSVKEHLGHLVDLEELDQKRLREYLSCAAVLSPADIGKSGY